MRSLMILLTMCVFSLPSAFAQNDAEPPQSWRLVYENDADGARVAGSKQALMTAVRNGKPVRIYYAGARVEHSADALFLTIFENEVYAQIEAINSQRPSVDPPKVAFRQVGQQWRMIVGTNGYFTALMDGNEEPNERKQGTRWFVQD